MLMVDRVYGAFGRYEAHVRKNELIERSDTSWAFVGAVNRENHYCLYAARYIPVFVSREGENATEMEGVKVRIASMRSSR